MPKLHRTGLLLVTAATLSGVVLTGCSSAKKSATDAAAGGAITKIKVNLSNDNCAADPATVAAGAATFTIKNENGSAVSEAELVSGSKILGEKEGLTPGLSGNFSLNLQPGSYEIYCPNAKTERSSFTVTGASASPTATAGAVALLGEATSGYRQYVLQQADKLLTLTTGFTAAVTAGEVAKAKSLYAPARSPYEAIEPVAESFGDLDPAIDARDGDVPADQWGGFHRIEQQLWVHGNTTGMAPVAAKLLTDVKTLITKINDTTYQPADLANGATDLLTEVGKTKLAGEEERYSRTDLTDIQANLEGSQAAFELLAPALKISDPSLVSEIQARFIDMRTLMQKYATGGGNFQPYTRLNKAQIKALTVAVNALAEPLSKVGEKIVAIK
jgi:iron uptake system component EfeO